ncbi:hypothetical protein [Roseibium alexandrii]|uniref:hypothetical protein n=1 Tax=Roseibium alexandrii TaxID=388408 RepID=UPI00375398B1
MDRALARHSQRNDAVVGSLTLKLCQRQRLPLSERELGSEQERKVLSSERASRSNNNTVTLPANLSTLVPQLPSCVDLEVLKGHMEQQWRRKVQDINL